MAQPFPEQDPFAIIGVSTLFHLAKRGVTAALVDRRTIASGMTWHAAGIIEQLRDSTAQTEQGKYAALLFREPKQKNGQATGYRPNVIINLAICDVPHEQQCNTDSSVFETGRPQNASDFCAAALENLDKWGAEELVPAGKR